MLRVYATVTNPEIGLNYIIPNNTYEGILIGLRFGADIALAQGTWRYGDYGRLTSGYGNPNVSILTPEIPNSLSPNYYFILNIGYFLSW